MKEIQRKILKSKNFAVFDSEYYTSLEMDQEHPEDVSNNLFDHKITFFGLKQNCTFFQKSLPNTLKPPVGRREHLKLFSVSKLDEY